MKLYIAVLDEFPDYMVPTLVAHSMLGAHLQFARQYIAHEDKPVNPYKNYLYWLENSFKKCVIRVNNKEFAKISAIPNVYLGHENNTLQGEPSCAIIVPCEDEDRPNVLKFSKLWKPKNENSRN